MDEMNRKPDTHEQEEIHAHDNLHSHGEQVKCPRCGSTDISMNMKTGKLRCNFCRFEFEEERYFEEDQRIDELKDIYISPGAKEIFEDSEEVLTLKCPSCAAEVVINTEEATQARCHWCRSTLSINDSIANGAVPDVVLPFAITKEVAQGEIDKFVKKRKFFAHPTFTKEFTTENIHGVYFPYLIVDTNAHANFHGTGEILTRRYRVKTGEDTSQTYYDADAYYVERDFDIAINDLTIEASQDKLNVQDSQKTTNIINSIMPFDTENCVKYDSNFLRGFTSERRDVNVEDLKNIVDQQSADIAKFAANDSLSRYDRGVAWENEDFQVKGQRWHAAYLPVWLYSYMQKKGSTNILHYVAVNARTRETMGSVPINMVRLWLVSILIELFGGLMMFPLGGVLTSDDSDYRWLLLLPGIVFFIIMYARYRNAGARHTYEHETEKTVSNLVEVDEFIEKRRGLSNSKIRGMNNTTLRGNLNQSMIPNIDLDQLKIDDIDLNNIQNFFKK